MFPALELALLLEAPLAAYLVALPVITVVRTGDYAMAVGTSLMISGPWLLVVALFVRMIQARSRLGLALAIPIQPVLAFLYFASVAHLLRPYGWIGLAVVPLAFLISGLVLLVSVFELRAHWRRSSARPGKGPTLT